MSKFGDMTEAGVEKMKGALEALDATLKGALDRTVEFGEAEERRAQQIEKLTQGYESLADVQKDITHFMGDTTEAGREMTKMLKEIEQAFIDAENVAKDLGNSFGGLETAMASFGGGKASSYLSQFESGLEKMNQQQKELKANLDAGTISQDKYTNAIRRGNLALYSFALSPFSAAFERIFTKTIELATATIDSTRSLQRFYGASEQVAKGLTNMQYESSAAGIQMARLGISSADLFKTFEEMRGEFVLLSGATMEQNKEFVKYGAVLKKVGIETQQFGAASNTLNRVYKMGAEDARDYAASLNQIGVSAGLGPGELVDKFNELSPEIQKITGGTQVLGQTMSNLAYASRQTGIEVNRIVNIASAFDTFEGAADSVGRMNAILGGDFLNVMDLMAVEDPATRLKMVADAAKAGAGSFQELTYYERLALTEAMGLKDVGELALVMSGNIDLMNVQFNKSQDAYVEAAKKARNFQKVQEQMQAMMIQIANIPGLSESVVGGMTALLNFADFMARNGKIVVGVLGTLTIVTKSLALANLYLGLSAKAAEMGFGKGPTKMGLGGIGLLGALMALGFIIAVMTWGSNLIDVIYALSFAIIAIGVAAKIGGKGISMGMVKTLLALGAAVLMAAGGIALAAEGIASMADSISKLDGPQLDAFNNALIGLVGTLALFTIGIVALGLFATGPQMLGILGIGAAFLMIGVAIGVAAAGMGVFAAGVGMLVESVANGVATMTDSFIKLFDTGVGGGALLGMAAGMYAMAGSLTVFAAAMVILTPAIMMFQGAMAVGKLLGVGPKGDEIESFSRMVESLAAINPDNLTKTVEQVKQLREEMSNMMDSPDMVKDFTDMLKVFERDMKLAYDINTKSKADQKAVLTITSPITVKIDDSTSLTGRIDERVLAKMNFTRT